MANLREKLRDETLESLTELEKLAEARWVRGVLVRVGDLETGLSTARAIGAALGRLAARTRSRRRIRW